MESSARPIRLGIVGTGRISDWMMNAIAHTPSCVAAAVYSRSASNAGKFADKYGLALRFDDYDAFIRCKDIDAVYIGSPNALHYAQTMRALEGGKHVLCEKILALNEKQAQNMQKRAEEHGLVLLEAIRPVFDPALQTIKANLPRIGRIRRAVFEFCQYSSKYDPFKNGEYVGIFDHTLGNAALFDLGIYCAHCCLSLFSAPNPIRQFVRQRQPSGRPQNPELDCHHTNCQNGNHSHNHPAAGPNAHDFLNSNPQNHHSQHQRRVQKSAVYQLVITSSAIFRRKADCIFQTSRSLCPKLINDPTIRRQNCYRNHPNNHHDSAFITIRILVPRPGSDSATKIRPP